MAGGTHASWPSRRLTCHQEAVGEECHDFILRWLLTTAMFSVFGRTHAVLSLSLSSIHSPSTVTPRVCRILCFIPNDTLLLKTTNTRHRIVMSQSTLMNRWKDFHTAAKMKLLNVKNCFSVSITHVKEKLLINFDFFFLKKAIGTLNPSIVLIYLWRLPHNGKSFQVIRSKYKVQCVIKASYHYTGSMQKHRPLSQMTIKKKVNYDANAHSIKRFRSNHI